eukprot:737409-Pyramimonas_sp.AAC.1
MHITSLLAATTRRHTCISRRSSPLLLVVIHAYHVATYSPLLLLVVIHAYHVATRRYYSSSYMHITSLLAATTRKYITTHNPWSRLATRRQQHLLYYATSDQNRF